VRRGENENINENTDEFCLTRNPSLCALQVSGNTFQQVENVKYLVVVFMSEGRQSREIDNIA